MSVELLHAGFDGLKLTVEAFVSASVRGKLAEASMREEAITLNGLEIAVRKSGGRGFSAHTGEYGAELRLLDPNVQNGYEPGVTVDFRAFFLATEGLAGAERYFETLMQALEVKYVPTQLRVSRVDFAVDFLAPWFEPDPDAMILPARTGKRAFLERDTKEKYFANTVVTGVTAGKVSNCQLCIYDKRAEVIAKHKLGWLEVWNHSLAMLGLPPLDLADRNTSRVWRFEARMGSKCLRGRWDIRSWTDLDAMIGDAFTEFADKMRYADQTHDANRGRWPDHELWHQLREVYATNLAQYRSDVEPDTLRTVNRDEHKLLLDRQVLGLMVSRAAIAGVGEEGFAAFAKDYALELLRLSDEHLVGLGTRIGKAAGRYRFR